jgi:molecular chaperone GrpE
MTKTNIPIRSEDEPSEETAVKDTALDSETAIEEPEESQEPEADEEETEPLDPVEELTDRLQRLAAEFENYKKRTSAEFGRGMQYGYVELFDKLLPTLDAFDSASAQAEEASEVAHVDGFLKIRQLLMVALVSAGFKFIEPKPGDPFDPNFHEVLFCNPTDEHPDNTIFALLQRGYSYGDRLIRPAKIQMAVKPEKACDS